MSTSRSLFSTAIWAFERSKTLRGFDVPNAETVKKIARDWAEVFSDAGLDDQLVCSAVRTLAEAGETITASSIIKAAKALQPAKTMSVSRDTDEQDRRYYRSVFKWAQRTHRCPRMWPEWTKYMEDHARKLGVLREWTTSLVSWETADAFKAWVAPCDVDSDDWEGVNRRFHEKLAESQNKQPKNDG